MEIKRPDEITKADIPYIEGTIFAKGRIRSILEEGHGHFAHDITGLSELLAKNNKQDSFYGSQGINDPFEKGLEDDFLQAKYLIVFDKNDLAVRVGKLYTLFVNNIASHIETDNDWQQFSFADSRDAHIRLEGILNRIYENRLPYDSDIYGFAGGAGSGRTEVAKPEDIVLSPEPWPKEKTQEDAPAEKTTQEHEETLLEAIKEYLGRVARGEILKENLARYEDLLERSRAGDIQANRDMINEFAGFGGIAKVGKLAKGAKSVDAVKNTDDIAEAGVKNVGSEEMAGSIRNVNPTKGKQNCVNCSIATDSTLAGRPASALPGQPASVRTLEKNFGGKFGAATSKSGIEGALLKSGDGARGIVFGSRGSQTGHVFNVVNQKGTIRFLDGQTGKVANLDGFNSLHLLKTTK